MISTFLFGFIATLLLAFWITDEPIARPDDWMLYNSKYIRLRMFREEGAAQFRSENGRVIDSCGVLLRNDLAKRSEN